MGLQEYPGYTHETMAPLWHFLFPPAAEASAPDPLVKPATGTIPFCTNATVEHHPAPTKSPALAARSSATESGGCCKSSASLRSSCSCDQDSPAQAHGQSSSASDSQHARVDEAKGLQGASPSSEHEGRILYASQKGTAASYAHQLAAGAASLGLTFTVSDVAQYEVEHIFKEHCIVLVLSTYEDGTPPSSAK